MVMVRLSSIWAAFVVGLCVGLFATGIAQDAAPKLGVGNSPNDPIDCLYVTRLVVVDSKGEERAMLGFSEFGPPEKTEESPELLLRDSEGRGIIQLVVLRPNLGQLRISGDVSGLCPPFK